MLWVDISEWGVGTELRKMGTWQCSWFRRTCLERNVAWITGFNFQQCNAYLYSAYDDRISAQLLLAGSRQELRRQAPKRFHGTRNAWFNKYNQINLSALSSAENNVAYVWCHVPVKINCFSVEYGPSNSVSINCSPHSNFCFMKRKFVDEICINRAPGRYDRYVRLILTEFFAQSTELERACGLIRIQQMPEPHTILWRLWSGVWWRNNK
jgi:hypothetical protein